MGPGRFCRLLRKPIGLPARAVCAFGLLGSLLAVACGVPISAEQLALTPEATPTEPAVIVAASDGSSSSADRVSVVTTSATSTATDGKATPLPSGTAVGTSTPGATGTPGTATPAQTGTPSVAAVAALAAPSGDLPGDAVKILNETRKAQGLPALRLNSNLAAAAMAYARLMADNSWFVYSRDPHDGPDGSSPDRRIAAAGYPGRFRGEALAGGQSSAQSAVDTWLHSPAHAAILLDPSAVDIGIGYYYKAGDTYGHYWVLETGIP